MGAPLSGSGSRPTDQANLRCPDHSASIPSAVKLDGCESQLRTVAERWKRQYYQKMGDRWGSTISGPAEETYAKLLKVKTLSDLDALGLRNWVTERCDLCGEEPEQWLQVGEEPDYDARWINICLPCAEKLCAYASAIEARRAATGNTDAVHESAASEAGDAQ